MSDRIDLAYRPRSYFGPQSLEQHLLSQVKGAVLRRKLDALFKEGRHAELGTLLGEEGISKSDLKALEAVHPMFMGGNYLPDTDEGEVEIARIAIESTTFDVTSLYAKRDGSRIHYRVVDEYGGDTLTGPSETTSDKPLTLGEMTDSFLEAWSLIGVLEMNFEDDIQSALGFFRAESRFYPDFDRLCRQRVREYFPQPEEPEAEDE